MPTYRPHPDPIAIPHPIPNSNQTEIRALKALRHEHIIGYVGVFVQPTMVTILTEYATGGTVRAQIDSARSVGRLSGARVERWYLTLTLTLTLTQP